MDMTPLAKIAKTLGYNLFQYTGCGEKPAWHVSLGGGYHSPVDDYFANDGNAIELLKRWRAVEKGPRGANVALLGSFVGFVEVELYTYASGDGKVVLAVTKDVTIAKAICDALVECHK